MRKYRLKGHGGFFMREGWFAKGMTEVSENPRLFTKENYSPMLWESEVRWQRRSGTGWAYAV